MVKRTREQWLAILEAASSHPPAAPDLDWRRLIKQLGLPLEYFPAVLEAIQQGRWREVKYPRAYIKTVAKAETVKAEAAQYNKKTVKLVFLPVQKEEDAS